MQKKLKTLKLEQRPCAHVLAGVFTACLLLGCGKSEIIKLTLPEKLKGGQYL